jgi:hypothetical protein
MFGEGGYKLFRQAAQQFRQEVCNCSDKRFRLCGQEEREYSDRRGGMVVLKNVICSDRRCRMFRNEDGIFRSVIFFDKKSDLFRHEEVRKVPTGSAECSDRQDVRNVPTDRRCGMFRRRSGVIIRIR